MRRRWEVLRGRGKPTHDNSPSGMRALARCTQHARNMHTRSQHAHNMRATYTRVRKPSASLLGCVRRRWEVLRGRGLGGGLAQTPSVPEARIPPKGEFPHSCSAVRIGPDQDRTPHTAMTCCRVLLGKSSRRRLRKALSQFRYCEGEVAHL